MGFDITVSEPSGSYNYNVGQFYLTYNHSTILTEYGIHPRDLVNKSILEIVPLLNNAIQKMKQNEIKPNDEILVIPLYQFMGKYKYNICYENNISVVMSIIMILRTYLEQFPNNYVWSYE